MELMEFTQEDYNGLYAFMEPLWLETYGAILSKAQILFLLQKYFSQEGIENYRKQGYRYQKIGEVGVLVTVEREREIYIDKLYLLPTARGKGVAERVFEHLKKAGKDLTLNVNQANERAIKCYLKNGFAVERKTKIELENGMVNYDYEMRLSKEKDE